MRAAMASTLYCPSVERSATSWRLRLEGATVSLSTSVSAPTPLRARTSAAWPPTPPMPNTATRAARSASSAFCPRSRRVRLYGSSCIAGYLRWLGDGLGRGVWAVERGRQTAPCVGADDCIGPPTGLAVG